MSKGPKLIIDDPWLGKREIAEGWLPLIRDQLRLLKHYRDDGRKPSQHLLDDIRVYEYIVGHVEGEKMAELYMSKSREVLDKGKLSFKKMDIAKSLGWFE